MTSNQDQGATVKPRKQRPARPAPRAPQRGGTATAAIYRELRTDIVAMRRKPGEPIIEKQIAETYGVSRTPVREALLRLADEGLIEIFPQSGTFVARIPVDALPEAIVIRKALECAAVHYAAERATRSQIAHLRANIELQHEMEATGDHFGFHQADEALHALIADTAGYPGFWTFAQQVKVQVDRYRLLTLPEPGRMGDVIGEHVAIVEAIADHDPARAEERMAAHLDRLERRIGDARGSNPYFFSGTPKEPGSERG